MMFKCVLVLIFLYLQIQTIAAYRQEYLRKMHYQLYRNPYRVCQCCRLFSSGVRRPPTYVYEDGKLKLGIKYKYVPKTITSEPWKDTTAELLRSHQRIKEVTSIKVASLFRNNLIKVFGYVLHRPQMELNSELYTSLYFILSTIKLNQINILSMIPILNEISFKTSNERCIAIFEAMEKHLPVYLRCSAAFWKEAIQSKVVNMDAILKPNAEGPLKVDILEGMNQEMLSMVAPEEKIDDLTNDEKTVFYNFNMNIVQIMRYIEQDKDEIQQIFFGALLLYFPRSSIQPDLEESILILMEFLEQNEIKVWRRYVSQLKADELADPYLMVDGILNILLTNNRIPLAIKESIAIILDNLIDRNPTAINPHYDSISNFVSLHEIKIPYMLQYITRGAYPEEIVNGGIRLAYYLKNNYVRPLTLLVNFYPHIYSSPMEVLVALINRIIKRQPDLPLEIIDSAGATYSYLVFAFRYTTFPATMPDDMVNLNVLSLPFRGPDLQPQFAHRVCQMIRLLIRKNLPYREILLEMPVYKCTTPVICFLHLLDIVRNRFPHPLTQALIRELLKSSCFAGSCPLQELRISANGSLLALDINFSNQSAKFLKTISSSLATAIPTTSPPSEGPILPPRTLRSTEATPPTTPANNSILEEATVSMPIDPTAIISILQNLTTAKKDEVYVKRILKILDSAKYRADFYKMTSHTHTVFITGIMMYLDVAKEKLKLEFEPAVRTYLDKFFARLEHIANILKLITTEKQPTRPILARLIVAVPAPMDNETEIFKQLTLLLEKEELFNLIVDNIEREQYKNIGTLLQAVLNEELKLEGELNYKERYAAQYYVNKIQRQGFGQGKILWGVHIDVMTENIDIAQIMDNALDFESLNLENQRWFNDVIRYMKKHEPYLKTWDKWVYYTKSGDFTKGLLNFLSAHPNLDRITAKALERLKEHIQYDGNGAKPIFQ